LKWQRRSKVPPNARCVPSCFLKAKRERPAEIHKQIVAVHGNVMNRQNVTKWCREFSEGRTDVHDEQRSGRSSSISGDLLQESEGEIRANRRVTIKELHHIILSRASRARLKAVAMRKWKHRELSSP
jgi:transposase